MKLSSGQNISQDRRFLRTGIRDFPAVLLLCAVFLAGFTVALLPDKTSAHPQESPSSGHSPPITLKQHDLRLIRKIRALSKNDLTYATGSDVLNRNDRIILRKDAVILARHPEVEVLLIGHADERGNVPYNLNLGIRRGKSAQDYLAGLGINPRRLHLLSFGKHSIPGRLLCSEHREGCWKHHRIVHLVGYLPNEVMTFQNAAPPRHASREKPQVVTFQGKKSKTGTFLLLPAGKVEVENVLMYLHNTSEQVATQNFSLFPVAFPSSGVNIQRVDDDYYIEMISVFLGITDKLEVEADIPYVYRTQTTVTSPVTSGGGTGSPTLSNQFGRGLGDIDYGVHYQFNSTPVLGGFLLGSLMAKSTTGSNPFSIPVNSSTGFLNELPTGTGFWSIEPGLSVYVPITPVVFYGNISYIYSFSRNFGGNIGTISPGEATDLSIGGWFSFSQKAIFTIGYDQMTIWPPSENGTQIPLTRILQMGSVLFGGTYNVSKTFFWMVDVSAGVTPDAPNVAISIRFPLFF